MIDTDDGTPFVYFDVALETRVKIRKETGEVVSWSPRRTPLGQVLEAAEAHMRDAYYDWRAWVACVKALQGAAVPEKIKEVRA